ncbi:hypothetical protein HDU98_005419 [Podochytrium sp. JEL0797]|nr:hypothetical protein HDU98_005419 [Podochytrium sp. JEL0797]
MGPKCGGDEALRKGSVSVVVRDYFVVFARALSGVEVRGLVAGREGWVVPVWVDVEEKQKAVVAVEEKRVGDIVPAAAVVVANPVPVNQFEVLEDQISTLAVTTGPEVGLDPLLVLEAEQLAASKKTKKKKKKAAAVEKVETLVEEHVAQILDPKVAVAGKPVNLCAFDKCKEKMGVMAQYCMYCDRKYCMTHRYPEIHSAKCAADIKKMSQNTFKNDALLGIAIGRKETQGGKSGSLAKEREDAKKRLAEKIKKARNLYEPADGKIIWGAWVDTTNAKDAYQFGTAGGDSPSSFNKRLGQNAGVFHLSQTLPLTPSPWGGGPLTANLTHIEQTGTDAILFLTIYPNLTAPNPYDLYTDADIATLATQLDNISDPAKSGRRVMVRFAPEMNGNWFTYGQQPTRFVAEYQRIVKAVRAKTPRVAFVWAPNAADNYPFGGQNLPTAEVSVLDTNKNGAIDFDDDPFTPYWPGADFVDWVAISLYWKGNPTTVYPLHDNSACPSNYWEQMVQGGGTSGSNPQFPFYTMFAKTYNKPLVMPEGGSAFAVNQFPANTTTLPVGAGQVAVEQAFWRSYLSNNRTSYPLAKMFINFEFVKINEDPLLPANNGITRDYRITWDPSTLAAFQADMSAQSAVMQWAVPFVAGTDPLKIGGGQTPQSGNGGNGVPAVTTKSGASSIVVTSGLGVLGGVFLALLF